MALKKGERTLVEGCRAGDEQAWLALYRAYASDVGLFLRGMIRNSGEIDDLVQKVFLEFLSSLSRFRGDASIRTWLHRIARHVALREIRSSSRRDHYVQEYVESVQHESAPDPQQRVMARHRLARVQKVLEDLDERFREVWLLRELQGCSVAETADILEMRQETVRSRHLRARQRILAGLQKLDGFDGTPIDSTAPNLRLVAGEGGKS